MTEEINPDFCLIDADSIIYQVAFVQTSPALCRKSLDNGIKEIAEATKADTIYTYIKGSGNFRNAWETYKAHRKDTIPPEVKERITELYGYAEEFAFESDNAEADDYVSITARNCRDGGQSYVVAHIDKDLNCIPGLHYNFRKKEFYEVSPEGGYRFMIRQLLMGDSTDGIGGIKGMGPKTAAKITDPVPVDKLLGTLLSTWESSIGANWKSEFVECANLIYMRESVDDLRELSFEELTGRFTWKTPDIGSPSVSDPSTPLDSFTGSLDPQEDSTLERNS